MSDLFFLDHDGHWSAPVRRWFVSQGVDVSMFQDMQELLRRLSEKGADGVVLYDKLPENGTRGMLEEVCHCRPSVPIVVMTSADASRHRELESYGAHLALPLADEGRFTAVMELLHPNEERKEGGMPLALRDVDLWKMLEGMTHWVFFLDKEGRFNYSGASSIEIIGFRPDQLCGMRLMDLVDPREGEELSRLLFGLAEHQQPFVHTRLAILSRDGGVVHLDTRLVPIVHPEEGFRGTMGISRNVTDLILAEQRQEDEHRHFHAIMDLSPDAIVVADLEGRLLQVNRKACQMVNTEEGELIGSSIMENISPRDQERARTLLFRAGMGEDVGVQEFRMFRQEGDPLWIEVTASLLPQQHGEDSLMIIARDVSERHRMAQELAEQRVKWSQLDQLYPDIFWEIDSDLCITNISPIIFQVTELTPEQVYGRPAFDLFDRTQRLFAIEQLEDKLLRNEPIEGLQVKWYKSNGAMKCFRIRGVPFFDAAGVFAGYRGVAQDVTELMMAKEALQKNGHHDDMP